MSATNTRMTAHDWMLLVLLSLIWGGSFLFARVAVLEIPPLTLVFLRVFSAAMALNIMLLTFRNQTRHSLNLWFSFTIMGLLNNIIPFSLIFFGQQEISSGLAAIINGMTPIWTLLIAHFFTQDDRLSVPRLFGIGLGFVGVAVLIGASALENLDATSIAQFAVLGATISYGAASVFGRRFAKIEPVETARGQLTMSAVIMLPIAAYADQFWSLPMPSASAIWSVILLGLLCTALAYILFFRILASAGATNISLVTLLVPVSAIALGIAFLGEEIALRHWIGLLLIMAGLVVIDGRLFTRKSQ